jgi:hypothetical protein
MFLGRLFKCGVSGRSRKKWLEPGVSRFPNHDYSPLSSRDLEIAKPNFAPLVYVVQCFPTVLQQPRSASPNNCLKTLRYEEPGVCYRQPISYFIVAFPMDFNFSFSSFFRFFSLCG